MMPKVLAIDFDRVLHSTDTPVPGRKMGPPILHAQEAICALRDIGYQIMVHSCNDPKVIEKWMEYYKIPHDGIWVGNGKPVASAYVDDRAVRFVDWQRTLGDLYELEMAGKL